MKESFKRDLRPLFPLKRVKGRLTAEVPNLPVCTPGIHRRFMEG